MSGCLCLVITFPLLCFFFFFFNDTATTEIYTLSLHDALPISLPANRQIMVGTDYAANIAAGLRVLESKWNQDRKSTRLNSSHLVISYAVFCLKKKKRDRHAAILAQGVRRHSAQPVVTSQASAL